MIKTHVIDKLAHAPTISYFMAHDSSLISDWCSMLSDVCTLNNACEQCGFGDWRRTFLLSVDDLGFMVASEIC